MKGLLALLCLLVGISLTAQNTKGATPVSPSNSLAVSHSETYAVVVGISDYQDEGIPDLRFADKDALAFAGFLQSPAGGSLDEDHLKVLLNEKATAAQFAIALDWLWEVVKENDRVIIYFSGHGDVERKSITQPGYLLCWDAPSRVYMAGGAFNVRDLNDVVSTLSVQNKAKVILVTDACRAGKLSGSGIGGSQATAANLSKQFANEIKILSCQPDEFSIEGEQWGGGRGAFSYHLLDGLTGMADGNADNTVNLKEIGRYLEDNVTEEVAPQSQNPMVIGSKTEQLTEVFPEILAQLKEGKMGQLQLFTATESRGIEDDVLAAADTNIVEMYLAFKESLSNQNFLEPTTACADFYYEKLSQEPQLEKLHSSMRRNYAAALQDDAQQVINKLLNNDPNTCYKSPINIIDEYSNYPSQLEKAAELLGESHYMYNSLKARQFWFEANLMLQDLRQKKKTEEKGRAIKSLNKKALKYQPAMPLAFHTIGMVSNFFLNQPDSAVFYHTKAIKETAGWYLPYHEIANVYRKKKKYKEAEKWLLDAYKQDTLDFTTLQNLAGFYQKTQDLEQAEKYYLKAVSVDSTIVCNWNTLGIFYAHVLRDFEKAEKAYLKAMDLDSTNITFYENLIVNSWTRQDVVKTEYYAKKTLDKFPNSIKAIVALAAQLVTKKEFEEAEKLYIRALDIAPGNNSILAYLGLMYLGFGQEVKGDSLFQIIWDNESNLYLKPKMAAAFGEAYLNEGNFEKAENYFNKIFETGVQSEFANSRLSKLRVVQGKNEEAMEFLTKAVEAGFKPYQFIVDDPHLKKLADREDFKVLMQKHFPDQYKSTKE